MEAVILNFLDDLDSKINGVRTHIAREPDSESSWTQYHRLYDRYFFKGSPVGRTDQDLEEAPAKSPDPPVLSAESQRSGVSRPRFSNTLAEQFAKKNINRLMAVKQDKNDE
jgi:3'-5' exoribonuclease